MVAIRAAITLVFLLAVLFDGLRDLMEYVAIVMVAALLAVILQTNKPQMQKLRKQSVLDLGIILTVVPVTVLFGFVAAEPGELLPAEQTALLQTGGGLLIVMAVVVWATTAMFPEDRSLLPAILLPAIVAVLVITFVLHDYRNQTVLAMLAISYFLGGAAIAIGALVDEPVRRHVPTVFFGATVLAGLLLFDPGMRNIFERDALVQMFLAVMILLGLAALIVIPNPAFDNLRLSTSGHGRPRGRAESGRQRRATDDFRGDPERRG